ncbi:MAG: two-component system sensor histidine kinase NtrB [Myxococcota bacterium]
MTVSTRSRSAWCPFPDTPEAPEVSMAEHPKKRRRHRHPRRRKRREARLAEDQELRDELLLSPEERALGRARRAAEERTDFARDTVKFAVVGLVLLFFLQGWGLLILLFWGSGYLRRAYRRLIEPRMRERFLEEEVQKQVHAHMSNERRALEGEHARSMQDLSASIAHEIRNPITAAKSLVQQMEEEPSAAENVEYARVALEELTRVERSVSHLLRFARDEEMRVAPVRLADVIDSALETFRDRVARSGIEVTRRIDSEGAMRGDGEKLRRVVINLVGNAIDALDESGTPSPRVDVQMGENLAGTEVWLRIADNGPGVDAEALEKMFSPFYTSKANGTGLGLPICKKLVEAHGGTLEVNPQASSGAEFLLSFPKWAGPEGETP